ncbi:protein containing DUF1559, partial [Rhodopirellula maiorica SM1]
MGEVGTDLGDRSIVGSVVDRNYFPNNANMGSDLSICTDLIDPTRPQFFSPDPDPTLMATDTSRGGRWFNSHLMYHVIQHRPSSQLANLRDEMGTRMA